MTKIRCKNDIWFDVQETFDVITKSLGWGDSIVLTLTDDKHVRVFIDHIITIEEL